METISADHLQSQISLAQFAVAIATTGVVSLYVELHLDFLVPPKGRRCYSFYRVIYTCVDFRTQARAAGLENSVVRNIRQLLSSDA